MIVFLLVLTLRAGFFSSAGMVGTTQDTLLDGSLAHRQVLVVSGPRQAAVQVLDANRFMVPGNTLWTGELYRVDVEGRVLRQVQLPRITAASDTLRLEIDDWERAAR